MAAPPTSGPGTSHPGGRVVRALGCDVALRGLPPELEIGQERFATWRIDGGGGATCAEVSFRDHRGAGWDQPSPETLQVRLPFERLVPDLSPAFAATIFAADAARQAGGRFVVHAAAVAGPAGGLLLLGDSGAGKTSLALALCAADGLVFSSADRASIACDGGQLFLEGNWPSFRLRAGSFRTLLALAPIRQRAREAVVRWCEVPDRQWDDKWASTPQDFGFDRLEGRVPFACVAIVRVIPGAALELVPADPVDVTFRLSSEVATLSSGLFGFLGRGATLLGHPLTGAPTAVHEQRQALLRAVSAVEVVRVSGDLAEVSAYLAARGGAS